VPAARGPGSGWPHPENAGPAAPKRRGRPRGRAGVTSDKIRYVNFWNRGSIGLILLLAVAACAARPALAGPPSLVYLLLDTTRADRLGAWGGPNPTSPNLDALAASGVRFARHFANSHATRPSMPQLMTGRYYHQNILRAFRADDHPREFPFSRPDPTAALLPAVLRDAGFETVAVSAHPWVARESQFGAPFDTFDLVTAPAERGHASADRVVDRAIERWRTRDQSRPIFLYVHFMDAHMPRFLPAGGLRFARPGDDAHRFRPDGEPAFDRARRDWSRFDARDFTAADRRYFAAVYDTLLASLDGEIGRLLSAVRADDPGLAHTLVVVTADHGEELGEDGRIDHGDALADGVQHVPWIMAGAGIAAGRTVSRFTEHVDVLPTVLARLGVPLPPGTMVDGRVQLGADGRPCDGCGKSAAFYAWEDYQGIRRRRQMLRRNLPASLRAHCDGDLLAWTVTPDGARTPLAPDLRAVRTMRRSVGHRLAQRARRFRETRYGPADSPVLLRADFWRLDDTASLECVLVDGETTRGQLRNPGWLATGRGLALRDRDGAPPLAASVEVPDGNYSVDLLTVRIPSMPVLFGFTAWRKAAFLRDEPIERISLGQGQATGGHLRVTIPPDTTAGHRVFAIRLAPEGVTAPPAAVDDEEQLRRLRALGYVQ
jgi:arylsulfatase A-like enzyme